MSGRRPFSDLKAQWSDERRARNNERKAELAAQEHAIPEEERIAPDVNPKKPRRLD